MKLQALHDALRGKQLEDMLIPGYVDQDETPARFRAIPQAVFVELDSGLLELSVIETTGTMTVSTVATVRTPPTEDDMVPALTSIREQLMRDPDGNNRMSSLTLWGARETDSGVECSALQIELENGQQLFFDPTYHFGIRIGGADQRLAWLESWPNALKMAEHRLVL